MLGSIRLGTWLPNPLSALIVKEVKEFMPGAPRYSWHRLKRRHGGLGGGFDEFVPGIFGLHYTRAPRAYISDGGHYDNLGCSPPCAKSTT